MLANPPVRISPANFTPIAYGDSAGAVMPHAGRYARECVLTAFEMNGGIEWMADWAKKNPGEFFTKLFGKVITREVEHHASEGVEDLLARLDASRGAPDDFEAEDADYEVVDL